MAQWVLADRHSGIVFAPYTTIVYLLSHTPRVGIVGWDRPWIGLGVALEIAKWSQITNNRQGIPGS